MKNVKKANLSLKKVTLKKLEVTGITGGKNTITWPFCNTAENTCFYCLTENCPIIKFNFKAKF